MMQQEQKTKSESDSADTNSREDTGSADPAASRGYPGGVTVSAMISAYTSMQTRG